jgi:hypothetical protein
MVYRFVLIPGGLWQIRNVWSAAALQAKNGNDIVGLRECIRPLCELLALGLNGMRCTLVLFSNAGFEAYSGLQVSRVPGSTVVPSSWFVSKPGRNQQLLSAAAGL